MDSYKFTLPTAVIKKFVRKYKIIKKILFFVIAGLNGYVSRGKYILL